MAAFAAPCLPQPGTYLGDGRYMVVKELQRGGTAVVYKANDVRTGEGVAIKAMVLKGGGASLPTAAAREVEIASRLCHPSVCQLRDWFVEPSGLMCIVWELIEGCDLLEALNAAGGRLGEARAAGYFRQLLQAVAFLHASQLCHRDIKPENCMIEAGTDRLKIIDFGLSRRQQSAITLGVGTPDYMAPEMLGGPGAGAPDPGVLRQRAVGSYSGAAVDVWSMGVLLFLITSGHYCFESAPGNVLQTLVNISQGQHRPFPDHFSPALRHLLSRMLTVDPGRRASLAEVAAHPWLAEQGAAAAAAAAPAGLQASWPAAAAVPPGVAEGSEGADGGSFSFGSPAAAAAAAAARRPTPRVAPAPTPAAASPPPPPPQTPEAVEGAAAAAEAVAAAVRMGSGSEPGEAAGGAAAGAAAHCKRARETGGLGAVLGCVWRRARGDSE